MHAGKESLVNTFQTNHVATKAGRKRGLASGLCVPLLAALMVMPVLFATAQAQNSPPPLSDVNAPLLDKQGKPMTVGQLAYHFARSLTPPFVGSREADAITWLMGGQVGEQMGHLPPLSPIGGWEHPERPATVGDLTVLLVQQLKIAPTAAAGGQPTAQDYQNALVSYTGSTSVAVFNSIAGSFKDWVNPSINVLGFLPGSGQQMRSTPTP